MIPRVQDDGAVIAAKAHLATVNEKIAELRAEKQKLAERFRIDTDSGLASFKRRLKEARGYCQCPESRGACDRLGELYAQEPAILADREAAEKLLADARADATKRLTPLAWEAMPGVNRKIALAFLALLVARREESAVRAEIQAAAIPDPPAALAMQFMETKGANFKVTGLVAAGLLTREEVKAALPELDSY